MLSRNDILETIRMIDQQHLDISTITMAITSAMNPGIVAR